MAGGSAAAPRRAHPRGRSDFKLRATTATCSRPRRVRDDGTRSGLRGAGRRSASSPPSSSACSMASRSSGMPRRSPSPRRAASASAWPMARICARETICSTALRSRVSRPKSSVRRSGTFTCTSRRPRLGSRQRRSTTRGSGRCSGGPASRSRPVGLARATADRVGGDVHGLVAPHGDDGVGHVEVVAAPAQHQHRAHAERLVQLPHPVHERRDGLALLRHQRLHAPVADHEVGGRRVLVDEQDARAGLQGLHDGGGLAGGARRVGGGERLGVLAQRQPVDEAARCRPR